MVQSVERALSILEAVATRPAGVTALAERLELPKSTVARLLASLEERGAVARVDGRRYGAGPWFEAFARETPPERSFVALARPALVGLVASVGEDAGLSLPSGFEVVYVEQVESDHPVQVRDWTGARAPMHSVPSGLVLLADWPTEALDGYVANGLAALTEHTVVDPDELAARLEVVRARGFAWGLEEFVHGINSVAAPVRDARGHAVAAIHAHGPAYRFPTPGEQDRVAERVVDAAAGVSRRLRREATPA